MSGNDETFMSYCLELNDDLIKVKFSCFYEIDFRKIWNFEKTSEACTFQDWVICIFRESNSGVENWLEYVYFPLAIIRTVRGKLIVIVKAWARIVRTIAVSAVITIPTVVKEGLNT